MEDGHFSDIRHPKRTCASMIRLLFFVTVLIGFSRSVHAQTLTVLDAQTNDPITYAHIICENPKVSNFTNDKGQADITKLKGAIEIRISSLGFSEVDLTFDDLAAADFVILLEPTSLNLNEVIVSALKWRESSSNVPAKITSISQEQVALQNPQTAADLLGISGKVFIQKSQQGGGSPMIRGFATNRLIYTVDGVRMNNAIFRGGNIQNVINLDPFATESTEVLFGPGSVIYGSDAIGGVMSFQTLTPQLSFDTTTLVSGKGIARYASANNERTGHFDINMGWKKWALTTSVSFWNFDHLRQGSNGPDDYLKTSYVQREGDEDVVVQQEDDLLQRPSAYDQFNVMQKVRFKPNDDWDLQYGFHYSSTSTYGRYDRHNRTRNGLPRYAEWNYGPQSWLMHHFQAHHQGHSSLYDQVTLRLAFQQFEESRISRDLNDPLRETREENVEAYSANLDFTKSWGERHTLFYGLEYVFNDVESEGTIRNIITEQDSEWSDRYPQAQWSSAGAYLSDEFRINEKTVVLGGLRYNLFDLDADFSSNLPFFPLPTAEACLGQGALTGSLGMVYKPNSKWILKANLGSAFRAPNVDDIGRVFDSEPGVVIVPNPDLDAEYAYNADVSIAHILWDKVKVDFTAFYTLLDQAMVRRDFILNGQDSIIYDGTLSRVQALQNAAQAYVYGIQFGIEAKLFYGLTLSADINYQDGEEEDDSGLVSPSRHVAPLFGNARLSYKYRRP